MNIYLRRSVNDSVRRPCSDSSHVTAPYKLSSFIYFIAILLPCNNENCQQDRRIVFFFLKVGIRNFFCCCQLNQFTIPRYVSFVRRKQNFERLVCIISRRYQFSAISSVTVLV